MRSANVVLEEATGRTGLGYCILITYWAMGYCKLLKYGSFYGHMVFAGCMSASYGNYADPQASVTRDQETELLESHAFGLVGIMNEMQELDSLVVKSLFPMSNTCSSKKN